MGFRVCLKLKVLTLCVLLLATIHLATTVSAQKVSILEVFAPTKVYDREQFPIMAEVEAHQSGGKIKIVVAYSGSELGSAESNFVSPISNYGGLTTNLTISNLALPMSATPFQLSLDAYSEATLGGTTKEDSRLVTVQSVGVIFDAEYSPRTVESTKSFNLTFQIRNQGNDAARGVTAELTGLGGFDAEGSVKFDMGQINPGQIKNVTFALSTGWLVFREETRTLTLTLRFVDWRGFPHSQDLPANLSLRLSLTTLSYWIPIGVVAIAVLLFVLFRAKMVKAWGLTAKT